MNFKRLYSSTLMKSAVSGDMDIIKNVYSLFKTSHYDCSIYLGGKTALVTGASSGNTER